MKEKTITKAHVDYLEAHAITGSWAEETGIWSAITADDLPPDLAEFVYAVPGIVYPLRSVDGSVVHQIRRDTVPEGSGKYLLPKDHGPVITVHPKIADRIGHGNRIVIVEGTKQALVASLYAPDDVVIVGIQGCWGWSAQDTPVPELGLIGAADSHVTIAFDADIATNRDVWTAAERIGDHLILLGASKLSYINVPAGGKAGLDDYLGTISPATRSAVFGRILDQVRLKLPRQPARKAKEPVEKVHVTYECDMEHGETVRPEVRNPKDGSVLSPRTVVMPMAARIVDVVQPIDPSDPTQAVPPHLDIEVAVRDEEGNVTTYNVTRPDAALTDIGALLAAIPGGAGISISRPSSPVERADIANAIRVCQAEDTQFIKAYLQFGWKVVDGELRYLHAGGGLTPEGKNDTSVRAQVSSRLQCIDHSRCPTDEESVRAAVRASLDIRKLLIDPTPWFAVLGLVGLSPLGPAPVAAVALVGENSSGKSVILQTATAFLSERLAHGGRLMSQSDGTPVATDLALNGHDNSFVLIDDIHPEPDQRDQQRQAKAVDAALRRAHGASSRPRGTVSRTTGLVVEAPRSESNPGVFLSIEPLVMPTLVQSGVDRMLTVNITAKSTFRPNDYKKFSAPGIDGRLHTAYAGYLRRLAGRIVNGSFEGREGWIRKKSAFKHWPTTNHEAALSEWGRWVEWNKTKEAEGLFPLVSDRVTKRAVTVVSGLVAGLGEWLDYAEAVGAIDASLALELFEQGKQLFADAVNAHTNTNMNSGGAPSYEQMLDQLRAAVASGRYCIGDSMSNVTSIGRRTTVAGRPCIAIIPSLRIDGVHGDIARTLRPVALLDSQGRSTRAISLSSTTRLRCVVIPLDVWNGSTSDDDAVISDDYDPDNNALPGGEF